MRRLAIVFLLAALGCGSSQVLEEAARDERRLGSSGEAALVSIARLASTTGAAIVPVASEARGLLAAARSDLEESRRPLVFWALGLGFALVLAHGLVSALRLRAILREVHADVRGLRRE